MFIAFNYAMRKEQKNGKPDNRLPNDNKKLNRTIFEGVI